MLNIQIFTFNPFQENTYVISDDNKSAVIFDPGMYTREEEKTLEDYISSNKLEVLAILNTHAHLDHIMGLQFVKQKYSCPFYLHEDDKFFIEMAEKTAEMYGIPNVKTAPMPDHKLIHGQILRFGDLEFQVLHTPGHAPGHVVFYNSENDFVINGDVLFEGSYGRIDLPGGSIDQLADSIINKLFRLPDNTVIYTGHGRPTTIGKEKISNPILYATN